MNSVAKFNNVTIDITCHNKKKLPHVNQKRDKKKNEMYDQEYNTKHRFICTLCLNETVVNIKPKQEACAYCFNKQLIKCQNERIIPVTYLKDKTKNNFETINKKNNIKNVIEDNDVHKNEINSKRCYKTCDKCSNEINQSDEKDNKVNGNNAEDLAKKIVAAQTSIASGADLSKGLNLLSEVLNVFQSRKGVNNSRQGYDTSFKDACIGTEEVPTQRKTLSMSKLVQYSIEERDSLDKKTKFIILECRQPKSNKSSFDLTKHKSSSIPQMKLEELKFSLREKSRSKDTIEEVNRMFATVKKYDKVDESIANRPMVRHGPRVLPVVMTAMRPPQEVSDEYEVSPRLPRCQYCHTNMEYLSAGDSDRKAYKCDEHIRCDKCVYILSCRSKKPYAAAPGGLTYCECCKPLFKENDCDSPESSNNF